jgi:hypothetical protein
MPKPAPPVDPNLPPTIDAVHRNKPRDELLGISLDELERQDLGEKHYRQSDVSPNGPSRQESKDASMGDVISLANAS